MKIKKFILILVILSTVALVFYFNKKSNNLVIDSKILPQDYVLTYTNDSAENSEIDVFLYENVINTKFSNLDNIKECYISDNNTQIEAKIKKIVQDKNAIIINKKNIYKKVISIAINNSTNKTIKDAKLYVKFKNNATDQSYLLGNLSFINFDNKILKNNDLFIESISPIVQTYQNAPYTIGLICKLKSNSDITLKTFDMKLPDYRLENIYVLNDDFEDIINKDDNNELDQMIDGIYNINYKTEINDANVKVSRGVHTLIVKFAMQKESKVIYNQGGLLKYSLNGTNKDFLIPSSRRVQISNFKATVVGRLFFGDK